MWCVAFSCCMNANPATGSRSSPWQRRLRLFCGSRALLAGSGPRGATDGPPRVPPSSARLHASRYPTRLASSKYRETDPRFQDLSRSGHATYPTPEPDERLPRGTAVDMAGASLALWTPLWGLGPSNDKVSTKAGQVHLVNRH